MTAPHLAAGQVVAGRYTIRAPLSFSSEVACYHAVASSGHEVVLKLYDPSLGQRADVMGRLGQVNDAVGQLPLEVAVPVADSGYDMTTSAPYVVSEFVQQPSLEALLRQGPLAPAMAAKVLENLARALEGFHAGRLAHLALKPSNLFIGPAPEFRVRVCDFGASVVRSASPAHESIAKSASWWAPEQLQPGAPVGPQADVFAAALIAFAALTGRAFWRSCQSATPDVVAWQSEVVAPRPPASQRAAELGAALPASLDPYFSALLSPNPAERPRSLLELAQAVAAAAGVGPAPNASPGYRSDYGAGVPPVPTLAFPEVESPPPAAAPMASPGLPPSPPVAPKSRSALGPVLAGVGLALVVGGGAAFYFLRPKASGPVDVPAGEPVSVPVPTSSQELPVPQPAATDPVVAASAAPASSDAPSAGGEPPAAEKVELTVACQPSCDELLLDNEKIDTIKEKTKIALLPGKHTLEARKAGYITIKETLDVDKAMEKDLRFFKPGPMPQPAKKPCVRSILKKCP